MTDEHKIGERCVCGACVVAKALSYYRREGGDGLDLALNLSCIIREFYPDLKPEEIIDAFCEGLNIKFEVIEIKDDDFKLDDSTTLH